MAAKKKQVNGKRSYTRRVTVSDAPEGFTKVEGAHIAGFWVPDVPGESIRGIVGDLISKIGKDGMVNAYRPLELTSNEVGGAIVTQDENKRKHKIEVGEGMIVGVGGAVLLSRLRGRDGREVFIRYTGLGEKQRGKNQARMFDVFERAK